MKSKKLQGHMAVMTANIIFGFGVPVTALLLKEWVSPMVYMLTRCVGAAAIFWLISLFLPSEHVERRDLVVICCGGLLGFDRRWQPGHWSSPRPSISLSSPASPP